MRKIVHIIIGLNVGGAELMLKRLVLNSKSLDGYKHEIISLTDLGVVGKDLKHAGVQVYTLGMNNIFSLLSIFLSLRSLLKKIQPDVVQTWMYHADFIGGITAKSLGIKKIIWGIRTTDVSQGGSKLTIILRSICAKLSYSVPTDIVCAAHVSKDLHIKVGYDAKKMHVIPNGFELNKLVATEEDRNRIRQEFNIPRDAVVIGSIGRFNIVKNQKIFIETAKHLVSLYPNLVFMLVGRDNTPENIELMSWLNENHLADNFRLLGQRSDIPACFKAMNLFCLHSKTEGFPNVLAEAILSNTLCLSTNVGDVKYLLQEDFIVSENTSLSLAEKIKYILNLNLEDVELIKKHQNYRIVSHYSMVVCIENFHKLYG